MKRNFHKILSAALAFSIGLNLYAQGAVTGKNFDNFSINQNFGENDINMLTLPNGFTVLVKEDYSQGLVHATFSCRAGFSSQTADTAGFFPLYTQLFFSTDQEKFDRLSEITQITSSCNADSSTYTTDITRESFESLIELFAKCAIYPSFEDAVLKKQYEEMKEQVVSYAASTTGFINSSIDARIFSETPWKHDSGVYPSAFRNLSIPEVRAILSDIGNRWYTPKNSALFICGNISKEEVYAICKKHFSDWPQYFAPYSFESNGEQKLKVNTKKKFVITDDALSKDLTQVVVQYTGLSMSQADILSAAYNSSSSPYRTLELSDPAIAIRSKDYLSAAVSHSSSSSRLILQALLESPYSFSETKPNNIPDAAQQAELFVTKAKEASKLSKNDFENAQNEILVKYKGQSGNSILTMELLSDFWGFCPDRSSQGFYSRFNQLIKDVISEDLFTLSKAAQRDVPYVFVLVSNESYLNAKDSFDFYGYERITTENSSWYADKKNIEKALESLAEKDDPQKQETAFNQKSPAQRFFEANEKTISSFKLKNSIPVVVKETKDSQTTVISICIKGGEAASPATEHFLRTVMVNHFAVNIQKEINRLKAENSFKGQSEVRSRTDESLSYIDIHCGAEDCAAALTACTTAIIYGDILPVTADHLVYEQRTQWLTKSADLSFQMRNKAFQSIYGNNAFSNAFTTDKDILQKTTYSSIQDCYTQLLNASLYSIVLTGDVSVKDAQKMCEASFGLLKKQKKNNSEISIPAANVKNTSVKFALKHTFTTDRPAEEASPESPILIPTSDFTDPVQFYFAAPDNSKDRMIFNALLYEIAARMEKRLGDICDAYASEATAILPVGGICTNGVLHTNSFYNAYKLSVQALQKDLTAAVKDEDNILQENEKERINEILNIIKELQEKNINSENEENNKNSENEISEKSFIETENSENEKTENNDFSYTEQEYKIAEMEYEKRLPNYYVPAKESELTSKIKNRWMVQFLKNTQSNDGTSLLLQEGIREGNATLYLSTFIEAEKLSAKDFLEILQKYLPANPVFKCYSQDSQK